VADDHAAGGGEGGIPAPRLADDDGRPALGEVPVRSTLVAPILPEPIRRMSPKPASRVTNRPNGIEPRR